METTEQSDGAYWTREARRLAQEDAERILALPAVIAVRAALSHYTCLGCGGELPAWRGSWCDACIEWGD